MADTVSVTQADRAVYQELRGLWGPKLQARLDAGDYDSMWDMQLLARHRLASTQPAPAFPREKVAKIIDPYAFPFEVFKTWDLDRSKRQDVANRKADAIAALLQGKQP